MHYITSWTKDGEVYPEYICLDHIGDDIQITLRPKSDKYTDGVSIRMNTTEFTKLIQDIAEYFILGDK